MPVFFNLFSEAEPSAAILIAHGTLGGSWGPEGRNSPMQADSGEPVLGEAPVWRSGGALYAPQRGSGVEPRPQIQDLLRAYKTQFNCFYWAPPAIPRNPSIPLAEPLGSAEPRLNWTIETFYTNGSCIYWVYSLTWTTIQQHFKGN